MLKNNVKNVLKSKFDFNPYATNNIIEQKKKTHIPIEGYYEGYDSDCENNTVNIDIPNYLISPSFKVIRKPLLLCVFQIITNESYPLLLYLLFNKENELSFIRLKDGRNNKQIKHEAIDYVSKIISSEISYAGFCETSENNIIFLKCCNMTINTVPDNYLWATPHELINLKTVINLPIDEGVTRFFIDNPSLLILKNEDDRHYISPVIGYYTATNLDYNKDDYSHVDIFSEKINDTLGNYYSFYLTMPPSKNNSHIIMRAALFLVGPTLNNTLNKTDSIIFNKYKDMIKYSIKNYNQHIPLSYH
jgi:hypothetical protein